MKNVFKKNEGELSILQIMGFWLMFLGVIAFIVSSFIEPGEILPSFIAISFFITMLGFSFSFPSLFKDKNKGLSTMRITVFMMTNVICMLLLKIGWAAGITSLKQIGLDQWWMGVIAFIFGAKATQSFFESKMATADNRKSQDEISENTDNDIPDEIFREALEEKGQEWKDKYAPVESISIAKKKINSIVTDKWCLQFNVTVKLEDLISQKKIPPFLDYKSKMGKTYSLPTDVNGVGKTKNDSCYSNNDDIITGENLSTKLLGISCSRKNNINTGTIGLKVKKNNSSKKYLLSCYHVLCASEIRANKFTISNNDTILDSEVISPGFFDGGNLILANVTEGFVDDALDIAIAELTNETILDDRIYGTATHASTFLIVDNSHIRKDYKITMVGRTSGKQIGFLESTFSNVTVAYPTTDNPQNKIGLKGVLMACKISVPGDSGAAVFDEKNNIIGIVFASNNENTYILPIQTILKTLQVTLA
jgi:hypothetical protein